MSKSAPKRHLALGPFASLAVENGTLVERGAVQMQGNGRFGVACVLDSMQANVVVDVSDLVQAKSVTALLLQLIFITKLEAVVLANVPWSVIVGY